MIQFCTTLLKPAFHRPSPGGHASVRGQDELHERRHERKEVVPSLVNDLPATVRHVAPRRHDLARVHGPLHERRADEHGRPPVGIRERGLARPLDAREGGSRRCAQGNAIAGRWYLRRGLHGRGRGWAVTRGWTGWWLVRVTQATVAVIVERFSASLGLRLVAGVRRKLGGARGGIDAAAALRRSHSERQTNASLMQRVGGVCNPRIVVLGCRVGCRSETNRGAPPLPRGTASFAIST